MPLELSDARLRAFSKCPAFYGYGGTVELPLENRILRDAFEAGIAQLLVRGEIYRKDLPIWVQRGMNKNKQEVQNLLDADTMALIRHTVLPLASLLFPEKLPRRAFHAVLSAREFRAPLEGALIHTRSSGILRHDWRKRQSPVYTSYMFSPYAKRIDLLNDPSVAIQLAFLDKFVSALGDRKPITRIVISSYRGRDTYIVQSVTRDDYSPDHFNRVSSAVRAIKAGYNAPALPCPAPSSCLFRNRCNPFQGA
jgi:hypothetical protein